VHVREEDGLALLEREDGQVDAIFNDLLNSFPDERTVERCFAALAAPPETARPAAGRQRPAPRGGAPASARSGARNVARWNELVAAEPRLDSVIVPLRDGVSIARLRE